MQPRPGHSRHEGTPGCTVSANVTRRPLVVQPRALPGQASPCRAATRLEARIGAAGVLQDTRV